MKDAEQAYREAVTRAYNHLGFVGFGRAAPGPQAFRLDQVRLEDIFVRLRLTVERDEPHQQRKPGEDRSTRGPSGPRPEQDQPITLTEALSKPLLLVGEPGAGKSTLLRWLALTFAQGCQRDPDRIGPTADADLLPILLELGHLPDTYLKDESRLLPDWQLLLPEEIIKQAWFRGIPPELFQQALKEGRCLLLFDGLDEVANRQARTRLAQSLAQVPGHFPGNRVVVGTRPAGLTGETEGALRPTFQRCLIQRFTPEDLQRFFRFWYALDPTLPSKAQQHEADALYERIKAASGTLSLAETPLLATLLLLIWRKEGALPERRVDLYERCCRLLVEEWEQSHDVAYRGLFVELGWEQHLRLLAPIAYAIHSREQHTSISREDLRDLLEAGLLRGKLCHSDTAGLEASRFLEALSLRSGLLQFQGDGHYGFPHLTFQEYLAARHLAAQPDPGPINLVMEHLHEAWWQEVHLLAIGRLGSDQQGAAQATALLRAILHRYRPPSRFLRSSSHQWLRLITPGRWLPGVQLTRRLAWLLRREERFTLWGAGECIFDGILPSLRAELAARAAAHTRTLLAAHAAGLVPSILTDPFPFEPALLAPLKEWLGMPGRRFHPQVTQAVIAVMRKATVSAAKPSMRAAAAASLGQVVSNWQPEVIQALLVALHDPDEKVRIAAAGVLRQANSERPEDILALLDAKLDASRDSGMVSIMAMGSWSVSGNAHPKVIQALLAALHEANPHVRRRAAESLGVVGSGQSVVSQALLAALHDADLTVRQKAADSLRRVSAGQPEVIQTLVTALHDADPNVRMGAARSLDGKDSRQPEVIQALVTALHDADLDVRQEVADSLGRVGTGQPEVIQALVTAMQGADLKIRGVVARSLGKVGRGHPEAIQALLVMLRDAVRSMHVSEIISMRESAIEGLGQIGAGHLEVIPTLLAVLRNAIPTMRMKAAEVLGQVGFTGQPEVLQALLAALHDTNIDVRVRAELSLEKAGKEQPAAIPTLVTAMREGDKEGREAAAKSLGQVGIRHPEVVQALMAALHDADPYVRMEAAKSLGQMGIGRPEAIPALLVVLHDPYDYVRREAAKSLGQVGIGHPEAIPALLAVLHDAYDYARAAAAKSLGQVGIGQREVIQALLAALHDTSVNVSWTAAESLVQLGSEQEEVRSALLDALHDRDRNVRRRAADGLGKMKITNPEQLRLALVVLNRRLYALGKYERKEALEAISRLVAGLAMPGSRWKPVQSELERARRRRLASGLAAAVLGLLALLLGVAWLSGVSPFNSLFAGLGSAIGLIAGLAGLVGVTLRDLVTRWNRSTQKGS